MSPRARLGAPPVARAVVLDLLGDAEADDDQEDVSGINAAELAELDPEGNSVLKKGWITKRGQLNKNWNKRCVATRFRVMTLGF